MSIRAGQILIDANGFIVDRVQTAGPSLNIPQTPVREVGNFNLVGVVRDIPDLTYTVQSLDVSTDIEAIMLGLNPSSVVAGPGGGETKLDFNNQVALDVVSPFRSGKNNYTVTEGVIIPFLTLESVSYKFGIRQNAEETFTLRGDSIYFIPSGGAWRDVVAPGTLNGGSSYSFAHGPAYEYIERGEGQYAVSVSWVDLSVGNPTSGQSKRLYHDSSRSTFDYSSTPNGIVIHSSVVIPTTATVYVCYGSGTALPFNSATPLTSSTAVKPAAIRHKDMDVFLSVAGSTTSMLRLSGVQSFDCTRKVTLQQFEEFGNPHYVTQDYDVQEVNGSIGIKGVDPTDLMNKIKNFADVSAATGISGPLASPPLELMCKLYDPNSGATIKTIYIPDATFTEPGLQAVTNQQLSQTFPFTSDTGSIFVFKGDM